MDEGTVLAECAANPDDDGPRLVWADLVGGERGELVVVQCDLARGGLSPAETARRRRRERELLAAHATAWAGELAAIATRWSFRRGFVETARLRTFDPAKVAGHPLLATVTLDHRLAHRIGEIGKHLRLRGLAIDGDPDGLAHVAAWPGARGLSALSIRVLGSHGVETARELIANAPLEQLWLLDSHLEHAQLELLVNAVPRLSALRLDQPHDSRRGPRIERPLRALHARAVDLQTLVRASRDSLERLRYRFRNWNPQQLAWLEELHELRVLEIDGRMADRILRDLARSQAFAKLHTIRVHEDVHVRWIEAVAERFRDQLELLETPHGMQVPRSLAVAGEVRVGSSPGVTIGELLHHSPAALLALGEPSFKTAPPAALAQLTHQPRVWDLPPAPVEERRFIGQMPDNQIQLRDVATVARRHAQLVWRNGRYHVRDLATANGTFVDGHRVGMESLRDGGELRIGEVIFRYFIGEDAHARAEAEVATIATIDPNTRLPINSTPPFTVTIANWYDIVRHGTIAADRVMRAVAEELLEVAAGERCWFVRPGVFGVEQLTAERVQGRRIEVIVDHRLIEVQLATRAA